MHRIGAGPVCRRCLPSVAVLSRWQFGCSSSTIMNWSGRACARCSRPKTTWRSSARRGRRSRACSSIRELYPDVAILDVRLPDGNGIEVCREIQSTNPQVRCLMLTSYSDDDAPVLFHHGGRLGLRAQGGGRRGPPGRHQAGQPGDVPARPGADPGAVRPPAQGPGGRVQADGADAAGAQGSRAHRPGAVEPPDRRAAVPGRGDRQELRLEPPVEARACAAAPRPPSTPRSWPSGRARTPGPRPP